MWDATDQYPSELNYRYSATKTRGISCGGNVEIGVPPRVGLEVDHTSVQTATLHPQASQIDLDRSKFNVTADGKLRWTYRLHDSRRSLFSALGEHRGRSTVPSTDPPSHMNGNLTSIFTVLKDSSTAAVFFKRREGAVPGLKIGYEHIKVNLKVDIFWCERYRAGFPREGCDGGHDHHLEWSFQARDGRTPPNQLSRDLPILSTEASADGVRRI